MTPMQFIRRIRCWWRGYHVGPPAHIQRKFRFDVHGICHDCGPVGFDKVPRPEPDWAGPASFTDWTDEDIAEISKAIRINGQPDSDGFKQIARIALNTLRGGSAVELVARAIHESKNPHLDADAPIRFGGHYMEGMPNWCMWVEYARPAVAAIAGNERRWIEAAEKAKAAAAKVMDDAKVDPVALQRPTTI